MASVRSTGAATSGTTTTSVTINKPAGTAVGDVLYAVVTNGGANAAPSTVPTGWTLVNSSGTAGGTIIWGGVYRRIVNGTEGASFTWSGFTNSCTGCMVAIQNADTTGTPETASSARANTTGSGSTSITANSGDLILAFAAVDDDAGTTSAWACATDPTTLTQQIQQTSTGGNDSLAAIASAVKTGTGATGALSYTVTGGDDNVGILVAVANTLVRQGGGTGSISWSGSSTGLARNVSDWTAVESATTLADVSGAGSGSGTVTWAGAATGAADLQGSASGAVTWVGSATSAAIKAGSASGAVTWAGAATGQATHEGSASGTDSFAGAATGATDLQGSGSGAVSFAGAATGAVTHEGASTGAFTWAGSATGRSNAGLTIAEENALTGTTAWSITDVGDTNNVGFAREFSTPVGGTVEFSCDGSGTVIDIYRIGYYGGNGARLVDSISNTATSQPSATTVSGSNGAVTATAWSVTASWDVPSDATPGLYIARYKNSAGTNASWIMFLVRDDARAADIIVKISEATWGAAYNGWGGKSVYGSFDSTGTSVVSSDITTRGHVVDYHRPITTRAANSSTYWMNAEYPLIRFLERNGYNVKYVASKDVNDDDTCLDGASIIVSQGHDEYWSQPMRDAFEAKRDAGVHQLFMSGNENFWRTRYVGHQLWCYKDTMNGPGGHTGGDPLDPVTWTGTWRDTRRPAPGSEPGALFSGTFFRMNGINNLNAVIDSTTYGSHVVWRNSSLTTTDLTLTQVIGFEADELDPRQPAPQQALLAKTTVNIDGFMADDNGQNYFGDGDIDWGIIAQRYESGAVVVGFGTCQWSWALDGSHDNGSNFANTAAQQMTVNLLVDLGATPETPIAGLTVSAAQSLDNYGLTTARSGSASGTLTWAGSATGQHRNVSDWTAVVSATSLSDANQGTGSGAVTWVGSSTGTRIPKGAASGAVAWVGSATGSAPVVGVNDGSATGSITWVGAATGAVTHEGASTGAVTWAGSATGSAPVVGVNDGSATGSITWVGAATGAATHEGASSGTLTWAGSATGHATHHAAASGTVTFTGSSTGTRIPKGAGSGTFSWSGSATGSAPLIGVNNGSATGSFSWTGSATGERARTVGAAAGTHIWSGSSTGERTPKGSTSGGLAWAGSATGQSPLLNVNDGSASGTHTWVGSASGGRASLGAVAATHTWVGSAVGGRISLGSASGTLTWVASSGRLPDVNPITVTFRDSGHSATVRTSGTRATVRENR